MVDFQACLQGADLQEVRAIGPAFTWTNNQVGEYRISSNIDRSFANREWFNTYSHVVVERLERGISDHCPQLIKFDDQGQKIGLFKFYEVIADHEDFEDIVSEVWTSDRSSNLLKNVWLKCQKLKEPLKGLNTKWYRNTTEKVETLRQELNRCQARMQ